MAKVKGDVFVKGELSENAKRGAAKLAPHMKRGETKEFAEILTIGPDEAEYLLSGNIDNRRLRPVKVAQFSKDMRHGRWEFNGESLVVAKTGELNDGQHRLISIVQTGLPQKVAMVFGAERETRYTVDSGVARTAGEQLQMSGVPYGTHLAAAAKMILSFDQTGGKSVSSTGSITSLEQQNFVHNNPLFQEIGKYCERHKVPFIRPSFATAMFYLFERVSPTHAKKFMDDVLIGANIDANSPAYLIRDRLMRSWRERNNSKHRVADTEAAQLFFRAWNYYATGKKHSDKLIYRSGDLPTLKNPNDYAPVPNAFDDDVIDLTPVRPSMTSETAREKMTA